MKNKAPVLFISHGSPMIAVHEEPTTIFLKTLSEKFPKPSAIVVVSAHWESSEPQVTGAIQPETIHDFYGFPKELYELKYPASGKPELAEHIKDLIENSGIKASIDSSRGLDHGAWNPLLLMYPEADIPVLQLSLQSHKGAEWSYKIGQAIAGLREENVLILCSGNLTHNLREAFKGNYSETPEWVIEFSEWVAGRIADNDIKALLEWEQKAPYAKQNHPTNEHFIPLLVAFGASSGLSAERMNSVTSLGVLAMDAYMFS